MRVLNEKYIDDDNLEQFIISNAITKEQNILLQIFSGFHETAFILNLIKKLTTLIPHVKIIGSSTCGEILDDYALDNSTILSFSMFEKTKIHTYATDLKEDSVKTAQALINQFKTTLNPKLAISFTDGLLINGEEYIKAFTEYKSDLIIAGGLAGDNYQFINTIVFTQDGIIQDGAVVALLESDSLHVTTKANFGWKNIGKKMTITSCEKNIVYEIDGIKAADIYAKYLGKDIAKQLPKTGIEFPLIINRNGLSIPRAVVGRNENDSLIFAGNLSVGDSVTFGYGNIQAVIDSGEHINHDSSLFESEGIFIYSCMARKNLLQDNISLELLPLNNIAPLCGFFTHGEFYTDLSSSTHELLNQTMTILSLSENISKVNKYPSSKITYKSKDKKYTNANLTLKALSHLISQTSTELEDINSSLKETIAYEVEKNRLQDQHMLNQSRLAQMGEMISMIAHQWRQPLNAISLTTNNLQLKCMLGDIDSSFLKKELKLIDGFSQHLSKTIDDFRNFFNENKQKELTNPREIIKKTLSIVESSIENVNIKLITSFNCTQDIEIYPSEVMQVLLNILKNAEDILLEKKVENPTITIETDCSIKCSTPTIIIKDNAGGIPEDILPKIFDPYFSTKLERDGTGLGLYMSKTIIEEHCGGKLTACNDEHGAVFTLEFNS